MKYEVDIIPRSETVDITFTMEFSDRQTVINGIPSGPPETHITGFKVSAPENQDDIPDSILLAAYKQFEGAEKPLFTHIENLLRGMLEERNR